MGTTKIGPREQHLRAQREQRAKEQEAAKPGRPRVRPAVPESSKDWRMQLYAHKANSKRKDRRK